MATTAISSNALALNTRSGDLVALGTVAGTPADGWVITPGTKVRALLLVFEADGTGDTVTITAGDNPPSLLANAGALSVVLAASDVRAIIIETARFMQSDGTIVATCVDAGTRCYAYKLPAGIAGGSGVS